MRTRVRWFGKVRVCERKTWRGWKEVFRQDFSDKPAGFPVPPPMRAVVETLLGSMEIDFPWVPGDTISKTLQHNAEENENATQE